MRKMWDFANRPTSSTSAFRTRSDKGHESLRKVRVVGYKTCSTQWVSAKVDGGGNFLVGQVGLRKNEAVR
jgi:hypothetical protein